MNPWNGAGGGGGVYCAWTSSSAASTSAPAERVVRVFFNLYFELRLVGLDMIQDGFAKCFAFIRRLNFFDGWRFDFRRNRFPVRADFEKFNQLLAQRVIVRMLHHGLALAWMWEIHGHDFTNLRRRAVGHAHYPVA